MPLAPLAYLKRELGFRLAELQSLCEDDKATLKRWAVEEMESLAIK